MPWGGSLTGALLKAGMSIAQVVTGSNPLSVPEEVPPQGVKLQTAYQRRCNPPAPAPVLAIPRPTSPGPAGNHTPTLPAPDTGRGDGAQSGSADGDANVGPATWGRGDVIHLPVETARLDPASPQLVNRSKPVRDVWVFGPSISADQVVNKLRWCRGR